MGAASNLGAALRGALEDSDSLIVICSPNAAKSAWVNEEIAHFKLIRRADRIFAVIVDGVPHAGDAVAEEQRAKECFPPALRFGRLRASVGCAPRGAASGRRLESADPERDRGSDAAHSPGPGGRRARAGR